MLGVPVPKEQYSYSRSVTLRTYAFLTAFAGSAWWLGIESAAESARFIFLVALAISVVYLWRWQNRRLRWEYLSVAVLTVILYPVVFWLLENVDGVGGDAVSIAVFVFIILALFLKLPTPKPADPAA